MAIQTRAERRTHRRTLARAARRRVSHDAPVAPARRQGDPAQAPEQDLLPDLGRRPRGGALRRRDGAEAGVRLVLPVLPRPRALPRAGRDARPRCSTRRSARPTTPTRAAGRCRATGATSRSTSSRRRRRPARSSSRPWAAPRRRCARGCSTSPRAFRTTRSCSSRPATARRARASSGSRSTRRATSSCRSSTSSRTTATPSPSRSR